MQRGVMSIDNFADCRRSAFRQSRHALLEFWPLSLEMLQHSLRHRDGDGMAYEGSGEEGDADFRKRRIAKLPGTPIQGIKILRVAGHNANGESPADHFPISREVGSDSKMRLRSPWMHAKSGHHFIEDQRGVRGLRDASHFVQKLPGLEIQAPAL